nr:gamma-glutamylcyclotransferase-like isoform X1 [Leptinotarsa decemlineata]
MMLQKTFVVSLLEISFISTLRFGTVSSQMDGTTLYFAFGSNLSTARMHICNPNAVRYGIGKLNNYQIDFITYTKTWEGYAGTIVPKKGSHVWGAIWEIKNEDLKALDNQEGVRFNIYHPITVEVETPKGEILQCRSYRQVASAEEVSLESLPEERKPTPAYLKTMINGAVESSLPEEYINFLKKISDNGASVKPNLKFQFEICL